MATEFDFSNIKSEVTSSSTAQYEMYGIEGMEPVFTVRPAWEINSGYFNARLKTARPQTRAAQRKGVDAAMIKSLRNEDRGLYANHVVSGWTGVVDAKGKEVPFSKEACAAFLRQLPDGMFDDLRDFCSTEYSFDSNAIDAEDAAKN